MTATVVKTASSDLPGTFTGMYMMHGTVVCLYYCGLQTIIPVLVTQLWYFRRISLVAMKEEEGEEEDEGGIVEETIEILLEETEEFVD